MKNFNEMGVKIPEILLPKNLDVETWSVVACDQYTQDRDYWKNVEKAAAGKASTLNIILPEVYLNDSDKSARIKKIRENMKTYIEDGIFEDAQEEFIYVERTTAYGRVRHGLVCAIDLESYEWKPFSKALIRATEATIVERIPPRMEIRKGAPLESPHIMLLVNDPEHTLVEATGEKVKTSSPLYSGKLMQNSGSIEGWKVAGEENLEYVRKSLENLAEKNTASDGSVFLFAVGDGNHSLATAKAVWDEYKKEHPEDKESRVRYALVEIVNIYDTGLTFEPIHRVIFNTNAEELISQMEKELGGKRKELSSAEELEKSVKNSKADFGFVYLKNGKQTYTLLSTEITDLAVSRLQPALDSYLKQISESKAPEIDYIHGAQEIFRLGAKENATGILLPPVAKDSFFATINGRGPLPRKSFSMGEADEKRFYLECRKLF
ncbi:MAG: DUF1015 domain-containing protein [Treponema sp.]|nr:DUF1015 domain-containing protein [Treponema sp.]